MSYKFGQRTPLRYDGTQNTSKVLSELLPQVMGKIQKAVKLSPELVLQVWPSVLGETMAPMTQAVSFKEGILLVKVKNSSLYSLLEQHEKPRLVSAMQKKVPAANIRNIVFRLG